MACKTAYHLILLRHGQSQWNRENRFTGWTDVSLTDQGHQEVRRAAVLLKQAGISFDFACTSILSRAAESLAILLEEMRLPSTPVEHTWRLNERHYGCLQGLNKGDTANQLGDSLVRFWRRSYTGRPPALEFDDHRHPRFDPLYAGLSLDCFPATESLQDTERRVLQYWEAAIQPLLRGGSKVLVLAHGNSLRALARYLEQIPPAQVPALDIPTAIPIIYRANQEFTRFQRLDLPPGGSAPQR